MIRALVAIAACWILGLATPASAEPSPGAAVALLPLDTERSLEIYGQPVASELARALVAGDVPVVVVGPRTAVPERARLIIDGTIALGKAGAVTISLRLRSTLDGTVLATLSATALGLAKLDGATAELSTRILPLVRDRLAATQRPPADTRSGAPVAAAARPAERIVLVAISDARRGAKAVALTGVFDAALAGWARLHHCELRAHDASKLDRKIVAKTVEAARADAAIRLTLLDYAPTGAPVPMARARVRVQVADAHAVVFDRVVATDTVLGDRGSSPAELAARVAREVLAIVGPHLRRSVPSW